jgi:FAD/FMN-containing dehydrogenase/Fe-S oxidoreductase
MPNLNTSALEALKSLFGERFLSDQTTRILYATDASAYREMPLGVVFPKDSSEIQKLVQLADKEGFSLIPRAAGTSLAGQVVGNGLVVDVSRFMREIMELNLEEKWVRVQPGVVRDDLNRFLKPHGLFFGPETSTANRAMIGGMVGNNSCGSNSVVYGSTREHLLEAEMVLADGSLAIFGSEKGVEFSKVFEKILKKLNPEKEVDSIASSAGSPKSFSIQNDFNAEKKSPFLQKVYEETILCLSNPEVADEIQKHFPKTSITRRNTGYALDMLLRQKPFDENGSDFNFCSLLAGSEGTLGMFTAFKLNLVDLPPPHLGLLCIHCHSIDESLRANLVALEFPVSASELMDHYVLECTKNNSEQKQNRFFVEGDPAAILVVEIARNSLGEVNEVAQKMISRLREENLGYHFPLVTGPDTAKIWALRKAGLGLLSNMPGDAKPVAVIEDTAVDVNDLPAYIREFNEILGRRDLYSVHYAHAGSGELHLRPIIDLKTKDGHRLFRQIATDIAHLVKKYDGSLSGEHGDGRLRGEFIPLMVGEKNYQLFRQIKSLWDPKGIFNPGKIVDTPPMDQYLRYPAKGPDAHKITYFDFGVMSMQQHAEQCNGSGDCRKSSEAGGTMCPSYMATRHEKDTTRARANILRELMTTSPVDALSRPEVKEVMDLCLSCKGCKSECPSNVDVGKLKAEFLQHYYNRHGLPVRTRLIGNFSKLSALGTMAPGLFNLTTGQSLFARTFKKVLGFAPERNLPKLARQTLRSWFSNNGKSQNPSQAIGSLWFYVDEFTNFNDVEIGKKAISLLQKLGYQVDIISHPESGRAFLSKGMLKEAREIALKNVSVFYPLVTENKPLVGLEPSSILGFVDEFPDLLRGENQEKAKSLATHCFLIDEFLAQVFESGKVAKNLFSNQKKMIRLHGHCHQKALGRLVASKKILSFPENYEVLLIPSGCCGMAGSFGYEAEHYQVSMQVGELVLFPNIRKMDHETLIAAPGTSCRHQIADGTGRKAYHPVEILWDALERG